MFDSFAENIDRGYTLEPPRRGGSKESPQSMFWSKNKKNRYTPAYPVLLYKRGVSMEYILHGHVIVIINKTIILENKRPEAIRKIITIIAN